MWNSVVVGMSGGVDSSVAAAKLLESGFDVVGCHLDFGLGGTSLHDTQTVADMLGIPLHVLDLREELEREVCVPFVESYLSGATPPPCIWCNQSVKFASLQRLAAELEANFIATGHYARIESEFIPVPSYKLFKGRPENDQSYMLCMLTPEILSQVKFPLGDMTKEEVREAAREYGLPIADKPDSMELCFIPDGDYIGFIERRGYIPPHGNFIDTDGNILGEHKGIHRYTVGQRRGLGLATGEHIYVREIRPRTNEIVLTDELGLMGRVVCAGDLHYCVKAPHIPRHPFRASVKLRHSKSESMATVYPRRSEQRTRIVFDDPVRAATRGQRAAFYVNEMLLGSAVIRDSRSAPRRS